MKKNQDPRVIMTETEYPILNPPAITMVIKMETVFLTIKKLKFALTELASTELASTELASTTIMKVIRIVIMMTLIFPLKVLVDLDLNKLVQNRVHNVHILANQMTQSQTSMEMEFQII